MTIQTQWEKQIADALAAELTVPEGFAGETPVGNLAIKMQSIDPVSMEMESLLRALVRVVQGAATSNASYWKSLCNLLRLSKVPRRDIGLALDDLLLQRMPRDLEARAWVIITATDLGRRITLNRLQSEAQLQDRYPMQWIDAALANGELAAASKCLVDKLRRGDVDLAQLSSRLPGWLQRFKDQLGEFVGSWFASLPTEADRVKLQHWLQRRGIAIRQRQSAPRVMGRRLSEESREFLSVAKLRSARLNGTEALLDQP